MRILHLTADWKWTGPADPMVGAVLALRERGHQVDIACPAAPDGIHGGLLERARERGIEPVHQLLRRRGYLPLRDFREVKRLQRSVGRGAYQIVHAHHTRDHLLCQRALRGSAARLVFSWHHGEEIPSTIWNRWLFGARRAHGLTVLSERLARSAERDLGLDRQRVAVVPGAVDPDRFAPLERSPVLREQLGIKPEDRVIGLVARIQPHRRFDLLLDALALALRSAPRLRLLVLGRGTNARTVLEQPVERLGLDSAVIRAGYRRDDYSQVLALCDALVFLVPGSDGSCRAALEGLSLGLPLIASHRGTLPELVVDGETGRLVDETPESLASAFVDVDRDPAGWRARGRAARVRVLRNHSVREQAARLEAFYTRLLGQG